MSKERQVVCSSLSLRIETYLEPYFRLYLVLLVSSTLFHAAWFLWRRYHLKLGPLKDAVTGTKAIGFLA